METYHAPFWTEEYVPVERLRSRCDDDYASGGVSGEPSTCVDNERLLLLKHEAELCLDRFNKKNGKDFVVEEIVRLNKVKDYRISCSYLTFRARDSESCSYLTFRARDSESGETCNFRGVIEPSSEQVLLCEIKADVVSYDWTVPSWAIPIIEEFNKLETVPAWHDTKLPPLFAGNRRSPSKQAAGDDDMEWDHV